MNSKYDEFWESLESDGKILDDGIYEILNNTKILYFEYRYWDFDEEDIATVKEFMSNHPEFVIASAYETQGTFLLSEPPILFSNNYQWGSGFNYGSTNLIENCPKRLLILAEND